MKKIILTIFISLTIIFGSGFAVQAQVIDPELAALLDTLGPDDKVSVIVTLTDQVDLKKIKDKYKEKDKLRTEIIKALKDKAAKTQKPLKDFLKQKNAKKVTSFWVFNGLAATAGADAISELANRPEVESVRLDATISAPQPAAAPAGPPEWNINAIGAPNLWGLGYTGAGVVVASMDTGVDYNHPDLSARWRGGSNSWFDPNGEHSTPYDKTGHGTKVMGVLLGGDEGGTTIGVAPSARWIAVKIFNDAGVASLSVIHLGFQWLLDPDGDPDTNDAPDVVNNSWGFDQNPNECIPEFQPDVQALKTAEIDVVFSGGNTGPYAPSSVSPANYPESFAVGAVDNTLTVAYFSGRGPLPSPPSACNAAIYPDVVAPGVGVKTSDLQGYADNEQGTSIAAPQVSGVMALLIEAFPCATVSEVEEALKSSAVDLGDMDDYGYGLIDSLEAYNALSSAGIPEGTDDDGDGYFIEGGNCGAVDCDDSDPDIYPRAPEIKHDDIDQDCNGYDLTIDIIKADYAADRDILTVEATSALGKDAGLELTGYGSMSWDRKKAKWKITVRGAGGDPGTVTVSGIEGDENGPTVSDGGGDPVGVEGKGQTCTDGIDNDGDGSIDCDDSDCSKNKACK